MLMVVKVVCSVSGGFRRGARGCGSPLIWVNKERNDRRKKSKQGK